MSMEGDRPRRRWRGWRYEAMSPAEKLLVLAGVPERFWEKGIEPDFQPIVFDGPKGEQRIPTETQAEWYGRLHDADWLTKGLFIVLGSAYEDTQSLQVAFDWTRTWVAAQDETQRRGLVIDLAQVPDPRSKQGQKWWEDLETRTVLVLHNILAKATPDRVQVARDILTKFHNTTRILVVAGANPVTFTLETLHMTPDVTMLTDGRTRKVRH